MNYRTLNQYYREKYGCKVYKLSLNAGFTCPNRDGTLGDRGCIFCSGLGSGEFAEMCRDDIRAQLDRAKKRVSHKMRDGKYIAYFQAFSNTYAPVEQLRRCYQMAMEPDEILGLAIGTRPDCLGEDVVELLETLNRIKPISVELGLQTVRPESISYIRRGYENEVYYDAMRRLKAAGLETVTHIILGLPGETPEDAAETTRRVVEAGTDGVKFHLLHVLRGTDLEREYHRGKIQCLSLEVYADWLERCLAELPEHVVVHRITGDGAKRDLIAPLWSADKKRVLNYLTRRLSGG